jgi:hypothetical protein
MQQLITKIKGLYPSLNFNSGNQFYWSPENNQITYKAKETSDQGLWALLHETGHALLKHTTYKADYELIRMEMSAWTKAEELANKFDIVIDKDHIEDCLDTYRDWLYKRSICPTCTSKSLQQGDIVHYRCFNCHTVWKVSANRFCRSYRTTKNIVYRETI